MAVLEWQPGSPVPSPVYFDANIVVGYLINSHRLYQKCVQLISVISRGPQLLLLEDPALGLSEATFLEILDLIQFYQRQGQLRHIFLTNHHPTAMRHMELSIMHIEDGLVYFEENIEAKKVFNF